MRNAMLDYARFLAAVGILFFHSGAPGAWIGYAALPFFLMLLICLAWPAAQREAAGAYARGRMRRLMGPWVVWSMVYGALKLVEMSVTGRPLAAEFAPWMWLTGPAIHLWFLPFALVVCLALWPLAQAATGMGARARLGLVAGCASFALAALLALQGMDLPIPVAQWAYALPAVALGVAFALTQGLAQRSLASAALIMATLGGLALTGWVPGARQLALAAGALWLCFAFPLPDSRAARLSADLSLTLYLAHPMVATILARTTPLAEKSIAMALATLAVTLILALALRHATARRSQFRQDKS